MKGSSREIVLTLVRSQENNIKSMPPGESYWQAMLHGGRVLLVQCGAKSIRSQYHNVSVELPPPPSMPIHQSDHLIPTFFTSHISTSHNNYYSQFTAYHPWRWFPMDDIFYPIYGYSNNFIFPYSLVKFLHAGLLGLHNQLRGTFWSYAWPTSCKTANWWGKLLVKISCEKACYGSTVYTVKLNQSQITLKPWMQYWWKVEDYRMMREKLYEALTFTSCSHIDETTHHIEE